MTVFAELAEQMNDIYANGHYNEEGAHVYGDDILIECLLEMCRSKKLQPDEEQAVMDIVSIWKSIDKWYA